MMSLVLFGYHNMGCMALKALKDTGIDVSAVITHRDDPDENRWFESLGAMAESMGIPVYYSEDINKQEWVNIIGGFSPDVILSCYYRNMIREDILAIPRLAALNLHGSLLPAYRGRCPVNWQIIYGETKGGITLHHMVKKADAGDIVAQKEIDISETDTAFTLFKKMEPAVYDLLKEFMPKVMDGTAPRIPQDHSLATYFGGRRPEDGIIDWSLPARNIYNLIRAVTWPYPGAFSFLRGRKLIIWWADYLDGLDLGLAPGTVKIDSGKVFVQTGKGVLRLVSVGEKGVPPDMCPDIMELVRDGDRFAS
ncbi:MAG: formyltransferase [Dissulfurimicrobium sp.]|uniref:formyltransferase n=1 Tax=Dissulfurimicrobium sp. TaxID=2022436 RepID=UPI00404A24F0